jgi:hypothetical protein
VALNVKNFLFNILETTDNATGTATLCLVKQGGIVPFLTEVKAVQAGCGYRAARIYHYFGVLGERDV